MLAEMSFSWVAIFLLAGVSAAALNGKDEAGRSEETLDVLMPNVVAKEEDQYVCASQPVDRDLYIVNFIPKASMKVVHHMLLYGCKNVDSAQLNGGYRLDCKGTCTGHSVIIFAWARDAASPAIPPDVGFHIGGDSGIDYLTLQIHYGDLKAFENGGTDSSGLALTVTPKRQDYLGGILLNVGMNIDVVPNVKSVHTDIACTYRSEIPIHAFAFRTHAHDLGKVISGYRIRGEHWDTMAKGNPQWPQAFYPMTKTFEIREDDIIATRCTFDGTRTDHTVHAGGTHKDEMCNLYIMYYTNATYGEPFKVCSIRGTPILFDNIPPGSDDAPPEMPKMDDDKGDDDDDDDSDDKDPQKTNDVKLD